MLTIYPITKTAREYFRAVFVFLYLFFILKSARRAKRTVHTTVLTMFRVPRSNVLRQVKSGVNRVLAAIKQVFILFPLFQKHTSPHCNPSLIYNRV